MGVRILHDSSEGAGSDNTCLYDSTSGWAFGPIFSSIEDAEAFIEWLPDDPRVLDDGKLGAAHKKWIDEREPAAF